jgi:GTP cyclohydrolase I
MRSPLPAAQRDSDQVRNLRESLIKSPELALKQAEEVLSRRGIKPTPERVDEYLKYLRRMLQLPEDQGDETP